MAGLAKAFGLFTLSGHFCGAGSGKEMEAAEGVALSSSTCRGTPIPGVKEHRESLCLVLGEFNAATCLEKSFAAYWKLITLKDAFGSRY